MTAEAAPTAEKTASALDAMVAGIMAAKTGARDKVGLRPLDGERVNAAPTVDPAAIDMARRQIVTIKAALQTLDNCLMQMGGIDQIDESLKYFNAAWRCRQHPDRTPVNVSKQPVGFTESVVVAGCMECGAWDETTTRAAAVSVVQAMEQTVEQVVGQVVNAAPAPAPAAPTHWVCPTHQQGESRKTRKGREYYVCPVEACDEFERLA